jgi:transcriptional regulator with XRE-family HTH domain
METAQAEEVLKLRRFVRLAKAGQLHDLRERAGLTQSDVARYLGVAPSNVSRWERDVVRPPADRAAQILELLDGD